MGKHRDSGEQDGHRDGYDHSRTKKVAEAGRGQHDRDDKPGTDGTGGKGGREK